MNKFDKMHGKVLELKKYPDEILYTPCKEVEQITPEITNTIIDMIKTMLSHDAIGLAANQVGIDKKILVYRTDKIDAMINPKILNLPVLTEIVELEEGCLSVDGTYIRNRPSTILVEYLDFFGIKQIKEFNGLSAIIIGHEIEHLEGLDVRGI